MRSTCPPRGFSLVIHVLMQPAFKLRRDKGVRTAQALVTIWAILSAAFILLLAPYYLWYGMDLEKLRTFLGDSERRWFTPVHHFVVLGVALPAEAPSFDSPVWQHVFYLPIVVAGWNRINVTALVILTGKKASWFEKGGPGLEAVKALRKLETSKKNILYFLDDFENGDHDRTIDVLGQEVKLSQVARLYGAVILKKAMAADNGASSTNIPNKASLLLNNTWLTLGDADLLPVDGTKLLTSLPLGVKMRVLEPKYCCGIFNYGLRLMRMYPISYVTATVQDWLEIMDFEEFEEGEVSSRRIMDDLRKAFGHRLADSSVTHWKGASWYLDQRYLSLKLEKHIVEATENRIDHGIVTLHRFEDDDRVNRLWWRWPAPGKTVHEITDAHLPLKGYDEGTWRSQLAPLLRDVFSGNGRVLDYLDKYRILFHQALVRSKTDD